MLPARNRVQAKKILPIAKGASQSVVLSSEPVLTAPAARSDAESSKRTEGSSAHSKPPASAKTKEPPPPSGTHDAAAPGTDGQYTYVTDESGYTWLYDAASGQYYYYDAAQGTYVPHGSAASAPADSTAAPDQTQQAGATKSHNHKKRRIVRMAGGQVWEDRTLDDWPADDYRLFAGDLGPDVTSEMLEQVFGKFRSLQKTHVVREKGTGKSRGYGFLSFGDASDFLAAWKEFNGKYVGSRPIKLRKSTWKDSNVDIRKAKRHDSRAVLDYKQRKR
ncbi:hypothetical protein H4R18_003254 [Coemansia javaensis]|uniref:RRM domain-containing protein n=1 Tax=Coemansia javaensis TaxID=2761396 RepID=A0A9W8HF86_9FUNG|nr:hypothetical protein H4R18_003254 [Coemansia javaensis]